MQLDVVHFMWLPAPLKERWCPHHILHIFFVGLVWNSSMASWACSISDSFTQDAFIGWYLFHLTKYSRFCPLSYLNLSTTSTSNSGSLWTKSSGVATLLWENVKMKLTLLKLGLRSPPGLPKLQSSIIGIKTIWIGVFFISLESYQSVNVKNDLAWAIWTSISQIMAKRKARSQTGNLTPDH